MGIFTEKNHQKPPSLHSRKVGTFIAPAASIEGEIAGKENVTIGGIFLGTLKIAGNLNILEPAEIEGEVEATNIIIEGKIKGKVIATEKIELTKTAWVEADIEAKIIAVEAGAVLEGRCKAGEVVKVEERVKEQGEEVELNGRGFTPD